MTATAAQNAVTAVTAASTGSTATLPPPDPGAWIVNGDDAAGLGPEVLGGKAWQLVELARLGARVPPWFCLPIQVCAHLRGGVPPEVEKALLTAFDRAFGPGAHVAVRSSARAEDSAAASFAGQLESYLFVTRDTLLQRVRDCIASGSAARVVRYQELRGIRAGSGVAVAVIVQRMVESTSSGVLFTADPTGAAGETVISAAFGLGEGVVACKADCDTWHLDSRTGEVRKEKLEHKRTRVVFDRAAGAGTRIAEVPAEDARRPVLARAQLSELTHLGQAIASARGLPQDLEFAHDAAGTLFLLQARAITTLDREPEGRAATFDNANIVESYPGVTSPLTFSFIQEAYARTFRPAARRFGIPEAKLEEHAALFDHLLARIDGRVYYDLGSWYRLYQLVPGFEGRLEAWEKALGLEHRQVKAAARRGLTQLRVAARIVSQLLSLDRTARRFLREMEELLGRERRRQLDGLDAHGLLDALDALGRDAYGRFAVTLVNDFYAQQLYELSGTLIARWRLSDDPTVRNALFCGEGRMESVAPARSVLRIAALVRASPAARALFESRDDDAELWARLAEDPALSSIRSGFAAYLDAYGDRTLHELKLETPSLAEEPRLLVAAVRNCVRGGQRVEEMEARERGIRQAAEREISARLRGHPFRSAIFWRVLGAARRSVAYREGMRLCRTRVYGVAKRLYRALGDRLARARVLASPDDVFFLTCQEVAGAVRGTGVTSDLRALAALRRAESARFERQSLPGRFTTRGIVAGARPEEHSSPPLDARLLAGTGCSRGVARGKAKVILEPRDDLRVDGEILVAPMTDPGWVLLMVSASGIVSERGSPLSHTAIVGRELGIPTVVGVPGATRLIQDGAEVELDGARGTVAILEGSR